MLEGFCSEPHPEEQIVINSNGLILCLRLADIEWLETADNCVLLHLGKETHVLRCSLAAVTAKLPTDWFVRLNPWVLVNRRHIKRLVPMSHGGCAAARG